MPLQCRWNDNVVSPYDATSKVYKCKNNQYKCKNTNKFFNVKTGTLFESSNIDLTKWFEAIYYMTSNKKGFAALKLKKDINVTFKTAWFMLQRIRNCFNINMEQLEGIVEVDETYIGGKSRNRHKNKYEKGTQGRSTKHKTAVFGAVERGGNVIAKVVPNTQSKTLMPLIEQHIKQNTQIMSDEWIAYSSINKYKKWVHSYIKHSQGEYVSGDVYTNTIESVWAILKRGFIGVYYVMSRKHLQRYIDEFVFRYNTRNYTENDRFCCFFRNMKNRLKWKDLVA